MISKTNENLKGLLEGLYQKYNRPSLIPPDPLQFVYKYDQKADMEIVALLASCLAYGRVTQIEKSLTTLFDIMDPNPFEFVKNFDSRKARQLQNFKHRFTTGSEIADMLKALKIGIDKFGSIENIFLQGYHPKDENLIPAMTNFCRLLSSYAKHDFKHLLPSPANRSACKRLNLFLRWMVRDDDVDTGLWKSIDKSKLIVPIDVHMARLCKILSLYKQKTVSLNAALEITQSFKLMAPQDPVKYDFALSRIGIVEGCTGNFDQKICPKCELFSCCKDRFSNKTADNIVY